MTAFVKKKKKKLLLFIIRKIKRKKKLTTTATVQRVSAIIIVEGFFWNEDLKNCRRIVSPLPKNYETIWSTRLQHSADCLYGTLYRYSVQYAIYHTEQRQMYDTRHKK